MVVDTSKLEEGVVALVVLFTALPFAIVLTSDNVSYARVLPGAVFALLVAICLVRRRRWAWVVLVFIEALVLASWLIDPGPWPYFVLNSMQLGLLLSPPMRRYLRPRDALHP